MLSIFALSIILLSSGYLLGLAAAAFFAPSRVVNFLSAFARSARAHFLEMLLRLSAGCALLIYADKMRFSEFFLLFAWVLVISTLVLLVLPWRWHRRLSLQLVPPLTRHVWFLGIVALLLGGFILFAALYGLFV